MTDNSIDDKAKYIKIGKDRVVDDLIRRAVLEVNNHEL